MLSVWELVDEIDEIEKLAGIQEEKKDFECYQLDDFEKEVNKDSYIVVGAGKDGQALVKLLFLLDKKISAWCDSAQDKIGNIWEGGIIESTEKILGLYNGEIILIA